MENSWLKNKKEWKAPTLLFLNKKEVQDKVESLNENEADDEIRQRIMKNRWIVNYFKQ